MYKKNIIFGAIVLSALLLLIILLKLMQAKPSQKVKEKVSKPVYTREVKLKDLSPQHIFYGHIVGTNQIDLIANLDGKVKKVSRKLLDSSKVEKNEIIFELDPFEYEKDVIEKKSILNDIKIELKKTDFLMKEEKKQFLIAEEDYNRKKKLFGNTVSQKALDDSMLKLSKARTSFSNAEFRINSLKTSIEKARAQLEIAENNLVDTKYKAPFSGKIAKNSIDIGSEIIRGKLLAKIVNTEILEVKFFVGETVFTEIGNLTDIKGKKISVLWKKSKYKNTYSADITKIDSVIDQQSAGLNMYALLEKTEKQDPIRPGAFVEIIVEGKEVKNSLLLPEKAIYEQKFIYLLEEKKPRKLEIKVRGNIDNETIVTGNFKNNDVIIITRLDNITEYQSLYSYK